MLTYIRCKNNIDEIADYEPERTIDTTYFPEFKDKSFRVHYHSWQQSMLDSLKNIGINTDTEDWEAPLASTIVHHVYNGDQYSQRNVRIALSRYMNGKDFAAMPLETQKKKFITFCNTLNEIETEMPGNKPARMHQRIHDVQHAMVNVLCSKEYFPTHRGAVPIRNPKSDLLKAAWEARKKR